MVMVTYHIDTYGFSLNNRFYAKGEAEFNTALAIVSASHMASYKDDARGALLQNSRYHKTAESRGGLSSIQLAIISPIAGNPAQ